MRVWRICRERYLSTAFSGDGARLFGGRWNSRNARVVYTSTSLALAAIEVFVNGDPHVDPKDLFSLQATIPDEINCADILIKDLPPGWATLRGDEFLRDMGDRWIKRRENVALRVPSAAIEGESNVLLNPAHPDFSRITIEPALPFRFDPRMFR